MIACPPLQPINRQLPRQLGTLRARCERVSKWSRQAWQDTRILLFVAWTRKPCRRCEESLYHERDHCHCLAEYLQRILYQVYRLLASPDSMHSSLGHKVILNDRLSKHTPKDPPALVGCKRQFQHFQAQLARGSPRGKFFAGLRFTVSKLDPFARVRPHGKARSCVLARYHTS